MDKLLNSSLGARRHETEPLSGLHPRENLPTIRSQAASTQRHVEPQEARAADSSADQRSSGLHPGTQPTSRHARGEHHSATRQIIQGESSNPFRHVSPVGPSSGFPVAVGTYERPGDVSGRVPTTTTPFKSILSNEAQTFAEIPRGNFDACRRFVLDNPSILEEKSTAFLEEAARALQSDLPTYFQSCIQQALIIAGCSELSDNGIREYLGDLTRDSTTALKELCQSFDIASKRIRAAVVANGASIPPGPEQAGLRSDRHGYRGKGNTQILVPGPGSRPNRQPSFNGTAALEKPFNNMKLSPTDRHKAQESGTVRRNTVGGPPVTLQKARAHGDTSAQQGVVEQGGEFGQSSIPSATNMDYKATKGDEEKLDPRYKKRRDAKDFFCEGRVFAMLWHENVGSSDKPGHDVKIVSTGRFGEKIFSHIRRMVVVRQRLGYCWCLAINSYGGLGVAKPGLPEADIKAHTIVHMSTVKPKRRENESGMDKDPIPVVMAPNQKLNEMSRLDFSRPYTVEWNVKVMNVGKVHQDSTPKLQLYWRNEFHADRREAS